MSAIANSSSRDSLLRMAAGNVLARTLHPARHVLRKTGPLRLRELKQHMPRPLIITSAAQAADMCRGIWHLAGHEARATGAVIFDHHDMPPPWLRELHAFEWLFSLLEGSQPLRLMHARALLLDWLQRARARKLPDAASEPVVLACRLINWTAAAPALLQEADSGFQHHFLQGLAQQFRQVQRALLPGLDAPARLLLRLSRAWATLALMQEVSTRTKALEELGEELAEQFLPDGGHISRSPAWLLRIMQLLLPLRQAAEEAGLPLPAAMEQAMARGLPMLRMLSHADNGLALFHGGRARQHRLLELVLTHDDTGGAPLDFAPQSGYARLARAGAVALVDVGAPPPLLANAHGALSPLALEFSVAGKRIITSCGLPWRADEELDNAARASAAHSMPVLMDEDAGQMLSNGIIRRLLGSSAVSGPPVQAELQQAAEGILLSATHDAWAHRYGFSTHRRLFLSSDGRDLRGEDAFLPAQGSTAPSAATPPTFCIRFHLHPGVRATLARDGACVMLMLPDRSGWLFSARGATLSLEESMLLAGRHGPRRSVQIVLRGTCSPEGCRINWRLRQQGEGRKPRRRAKHTSAPALPLQQQTGEKA